MYVNEPAIIATSDLGLYLLAGECILGFLHPDGFLMELIVQAEEYINPHSPDNTLISFTFVTIQVECPLI